MRDPYATIANDEVIFAFPDAEYVDHRCGGVQYRSRRWQLRARHVRVGAALLTR